MALRSTASRAKRVRQRQRGRPDAACVDIYEGALLFFTGVSCTYGDSPYKRDWGGAMARRPSSKPAGQPAARVLLDSDRPAAACRARPHCRFVLQLIHIIPHSLV